MMKLHVFFAISLTYRLVIHATAKTAMNKVPAQFVYDDASASSKVQHGGCTVTSWDGMDADGISGPPWVSYINCSADASYATHGVSVNGFFQVWLMHGQISLNDNMLSHMGESFWVAPGARVNLKVDGAAYVAGAKFELESSAEESIFTSSFVQANHRNYSYADLGTPGNSHIKDDPHICNGSSPSKDIVFGSHSGVDPASVVVVNCAPSSTPEENFVWSHFHPFGALYMPLSGEICFATKDTTCVGPGTARWTSPNLMYYEYFRKINTTNVHADTVRDIVGVPSEECQYPNVFAVTNFDSHAGKSGVPNFGDWPANAHGNNLALGIGPWGIFPKMTVQSTTFVVKSSAVMIDEELDDKRIMV